MRLENYHTHTYRCNHAKGLDIDYVNQAISEGFDLLGFSDHTPWPDSENLAGDDARMRLFELDEYVSSIKKLKEDFKGVIDISLGLECEAFKDLFSFLEDTKESLGIDYLILGNHYVSSSKDEIFAGKIFNPKDAVKYVKNIEIAAESHLFKYIAHPDLLFSNYKKEDLYVKSVSKDICEISISTNTPLEYNLSGFLKREQKYYDGLGFPCNTFWEIASTYKVNSYIGFDAHSPRLIVKNQFVEHAEKLLSMGLNVLNYSKD